MITAGVALVLALAGERLAVTTDGDCPAPATVLARCT